jgi:serine/threonine-protein kinase
MIDRYIVEEVLGEGGVAKVYRVRHVHLKSNHALKVLQVAHEEVQRRMINEGRSQASLQHPNVLGVTDAILYRGRPCLVMEYVDGPTLYELLDDCRLSLDEALELFRGIVRGMDAAHRHGLVHRDLKPDNVLLATVDEGVVPKIADFGLVKVLSSGDGGPKTQDGTFMGTPEYMAPEQVVDAGAVDQRADMFSLGCILYEMVCGQLAFDGKNHFEILSLITRLEYTPPQELNPDLPDNVVAAINRLLAPLDQRMSDCAALMDLLYGSADVVRGPEDDEELPTAHSVSTVGQAAQRWIVGRAVAAVASKAKPVVPSDPVARPEQTGWVSASMIDRVGTAIIAFLAGILGVIFGLYFAKLLGLIS